MIPTTIYVIGFLIYIAFSATTFHYISRLNSQNKLFKLISVYTYYSILIGYWVTIVDVDGSNFEIIGQIFIYIFTSSLFLLIFYNNILSKSRKSYFNDESLEDQD